MNRTGISLCVVSKIVNAQIQNVAVERVPDIGKRPNGTDRARSRRSTRPTPTGLEAILHRPLINPTAFRSERRQAPEQACQIVKYHTFSAFLLQIADALVSEP